MVSVLGLSLVAYIKPVHAIPDSLPNRSIQLSDAEPAAAGVTYLVSFDILTPGTIGSIRIQFCSEDPIADQPCTNPSGFSASGAILSAQTGTNDFSIDPSSTVNEIILTRTAGAVGVISMSFTFDNITNPSTLGSFYARIQTYATTDASGLATDKGGIAMTTASGFDVTTEVPPILTFCAGVTVTSDDCSVIVGDTLDVGILSSRQTAKGTSQFVVGTNASGGYTVSIEGTTMTAGNEIITPLTNQTASQTGVSQFGINLRQNSNPALGEEPGGFGVGSPAAAYNSPNFFRFRNGDTLATRAATENYRKFTVSYIANIPSTQAPGVYATTLNYICLANF